MRLIGEEGKQIGVVSLSKALQHAQDVELDLIEISPDADPPVCKIISLDKYKYELQQKEKRAKKKLKEVEIKEFRIRLNIFDNDLQQRINRMEEFMGKGDKIKITLLFRGRENTKKELGYDLMKKILGYFGPRILVEKGPIKQGSMMLFIFTPTKEFNTHGKKNQTQN